MAERTKSAENRTEDDEKALARLVAMRFSNHSVTDLNEGNTSQLR
jgi:hypothetical protein